MGGFGGGGNSSGSVDAPNTKKSKVSVKSKAKIAGNKVLDFVKGGGVTGAIVRGVTKALDPKTNKKGKTGDVYGGKTSYGYNEAKEKIDYKSPPKMNTGGDRDDSPKGIEVAKQTGSLTAQTQQTAVDAAPDGPTNIEMPEETEAERLLRIKRQGRRATILNVPDDELTLSKKILLG